MCVVVSYPDANDECVVMQVKETFSVFFRKFDDGVVNLYHF